MRVELAKWSGLVTGRIDPPDARVITLPIKPSPRGGSGTFLAADTDSVQWWVKPLNNVQGERVTVTEAIVGAAGRLIGTPVCETAIVWLPEEIAGWEFRPGRVIEPGYAHASRGVTGAQEDRRLLFRDRDENITRQAGAVALHDWCWGGDDQWLYSESEDRRLYSHDQRFVYSLIRFVPDPARGEFVNVGAIVGSEASSEWQVRQVENPVRARAIDDRSLLDGVWSFIDRVGLEIDRFEAETESLFGPGQELTEAWLEALYSDHQNIVQLSPPSPLVAESADEAMDRVFERMVFDPAARRFRFQKKHAALAAVRGAYAVRNVPRGTALRERVQLRTRHHDGRFDFAVTNDTVLQPTQTFSFQVPDQESLTQQVRAWGWTIHNARESGGDVLTSGGGRFAVEPDVDIEVVYVPPAPEQPAPALDDARSVFEALAITAQPLSDALAVAARADELLVKAGVGHLDPG